MPHRPSPRHRDPLRGARRRRLGVLGASAVVLAGVLPTLGAQAAVSGLTAGQEISGIVAVNEARGGDNNCIAQDRSSSRLSVTRVADGQVVHTASRNGSGALSSTWDTLGQPLGSYRVQSWTRDSRRSGFANLGCTAQSEVQASNLVVTLRNRAAVRVSAPASVVSGEDLAVSVTTSVQANGVTDRALGGRSVTVTVGDDERTVTTDAQGRGSVVVDLPDLPRGALEVSASVADDASYLGLDGSTSTTVARRSTALRYDGTTRVQPGRKATLAAVLTDVTPGSARAGEPVADLPVALSIGDDTSDATTDAEGVAQRTVTVEGQSRVEPVAAVFAGTEIWGPSRDDVKLYVGDAAAEPAAEEHGLIGGLTRLLGGIVADLGTAVGGLTGSLPNSGAAVDPLLEQLAAQLGDLGDEVGRIGDPLDDTVDAVIDGVTAGSPLADLADAARFRWRAVLAQPDGTQRAREFAAVIGIPQYLDVTGDGKPDVLARVTLEGTTPVITTLRADTEGTPLPLSLQAVVGLPGDATRYRFGFDARTSDAPREFRAAVVLAPGGAALEVASSGTAPLAVTGAIVPEQAEPSDETPVASGDDVELDDAPLEAPQDLAPREQRFGISFDHAPEAARLALSLGGTQQVAGTFTTQRPTEIGIQFTEDGGSDEVMVVDGTFRSVDGEVGVGLTGTEETGLKASVTSDVELEDVTLRAQTLAKGRTAQDVRLSLQEVPTSIDFTLGADGAGGLEASGPIGTFAAGYSRGGEIVTLDDPSYLRLVDEGGHDSVAVRLPGFEGMTIDLQETISLGLTIAPTPLRALVTQETLTLDARIEDAPRTLTLGLSDDGGVSVRGSDPIESVTVEATDQSGRLLGADQLDLRLTDVPELLAVEVGDDGVSFDTGGKAVGLVEVDAHSGTPLELPADKDGLALRQREDDTRLAARVSGLRAIRASLGDQPDVLLDTVAGRVFEISLDDGGDPVTATIDHLQPNMTLRLVEAEGATRLEYAADASTNRLSFDLGGLSGSIAGPLPARLRVCMAEDEACLPGAGIDDPGIGSVQFDASEYTTLDLVDSAGGLSANGLRLQRLDLTGDLDADDGGPVYLNTTSFGGECGTAGCEHPIRGGNVVAELGSARLTFTPGNGFSAVDARTDLETTKLFGQTTGVRATGGTGIVRCVSATALQVRVEVIGIPITLNLRDAICNVNRTPR